MHILLPVLVLVSFGVGCGPVREQPTPEPASASSTPAPAPTRAADVPAAAAQLTRLAGTPAGSNCRPGDRTALLDLHARFPDDPEIDAPLLGVLRVCGDWTGMAELLERRQGGPHAVSPVSLAKVQIKAKKFAEAIALLGPLAQASPEDLEVRWALGLALFDGGRRDEAIPHLDAVAETRAEAGQADALTLKGLVLLGRGKAAEALPVLERAGAVEPGNPSSWNAIGRARARLGDETGAQAAFETADARHAEATRAEALTYRIGALVTALKIARAEGDTAAVFEIIDTLVPIAPPTLTASVLEMRASMLTQQGRSAEAAADTAAAAEARRLVGGTPQ